MPINLNLNDIVSRVKTSKELQNEIGEIVVSSVQQNFQTGGRVGDKEYEGGSKKWQPVSKDYAKYKKSKKKDPMKVLLFSGQLRASITHKSQGGTISVGSNKVYAARHQYGGKGTPARPFIVVQNEDREGIQDAIVADLSRFFKQ